MKYIEDSEGFNFHSVDDIEEITRDSTGSHVSYFATKRDGYCFEMTETEFLLLNGEISTVAVDIDICSVWINEEGAASMQEHGKVTHALITSDRVYYFGVGATLSSVISPASNEEWCYRVGDKYSIPYPFDEGFSMGKGEIIEYLRDHLLRHSLKNPFNTQTKEKAQ